MSDTVLVVLDVSGIRSDSNLIVGSFTRSAADEPPRLEDVVGDDFHFTYRSRFDFPRSTLRIIVVNGIHERPVLDVVDSTTKTVVASTSSLNPPVLTSNILNVSRVAQGATVFVADRYGKILRMDADQIGSATMPLPSTMTKPILVWSKGFVPVLVP